MYLSQILIVCSKRCQINSNYYFIMKINNKEELQNITINISADIDCKDLQKMYKGTVFFLTIDATLLVSDPWRFRKNLFLSNKNDSNRSS